MISLGRQRPELFAHWQTPLALKMAVFVYFGASLFSKQFLIPPDGQLDTESFPNVTLVHYSSKAPFVNHTPGLYFPFFTLVELVCFMGWIKVAESLLNPFGGKFQYYYLKYKLIIMSYVF